MVFFKFPAITMSFPFFPNKDIAQHHLRLGAWLWRRSFMLVQQHTAHFRANRAHLRMDLCFQQGLDHTIS